jgi:cupin superfamily acireductone dioxygenase involved in methionine salvage
MRGSLKMSDYKVTVRILGSINYINVKNAASAFSKAIKLEKKIQTLLKENGFDDCDVVTISVEGVKDE